MKYISFLIFLFYGFSLGLSQQTVKPSFEKAEFSYNGKTLPYRILKPVDFDPSKQYPLHIFLHGSGERGSDNKSQLAHGSELFIQKSKKFPAIVIFPQCPVNDFWAQRSYSRDTINNENIFDFPTNPTPSWAMRAVIALLEEQLQLDYIDRNRVYLGGLSMGGMGTFELLAHKPKIFAAATPICGGGNPELLKGYAQEVPLWIFHGDADKVVPVRYSKIMVEGLIKEGIEPKFTVYPGVGHNSWTPAFAEPDLFEWIYDHHKGK